MADPRSPDPVTAAMRAVDRATFLPQAVRGRAAEDRPLPIGYDATCSQPSTVRSMLELLDVREGHRVLDVGSGSGWTAGLVRHLVGDEGSVTGVELEPELVGFATANLRAAGVTDVTVHQAEHGVVGHPDDAPYDRILVSAMAATMPDSLIDQLSPDGVMVIPVDGWMLRVRRTNGTPHVERHGRYRFVPLR